MNQQNKENTDEIEIDLEKYSVCYFTDSGSSFYVALHAAL